MPTPAYPRVHAHPRLRGSPLPIRMTWGIPRESGIQKAHTRSPAQYSQTRVRRRRQGAVIVGRPPSVPGARPWRGSLGRLAALGAGAQQPPRRRLAQLPGSGSRAPLRVGGAPRRRAHLTGGPPRRRPPRPAAAHGLPASERGSRDSARVPLGLGGSGSRRLARLPRGAPTCPGCGALAGRLGTRLSRRSSSSSSSRRRCYRPGSHKAPEWSGTRAHTPAQRPPPRPRSLRAHALNSHSRPPGRTLERSHLRGGRGRATRTPGLGWGTPIREGGLRWPRGHPRPARPFGGGGKGAEPGSQPGVEHCEPGRRRRRRP